MKLSLISRGLYIAPAQQLKSVFSNLTQMYLNVNRIPPVTVATIIRSTIIEWGPYSFVSSRAVFNRPSLRIPAPKPPASENSGSGLRGILSPLRSSPAMVVGWGVGSY